MILYTSLDRNFFNFNTVMIIVRVRDRLGGGGGGTINLTTIRNITDLPASVGVGGVTPGPSLTVYVSTVVLLGRIQFHCSKNGVKRYN